MPWAIDMGQTLRMLASISGRILTFSKRLLPMSKSMRISHHIHKGTRFVELRVFGIFRDNSLRRKHHSKRQSPQLGIAQFDTRPVQIGYVLHDGQAKAASEVVLARWPVEAVEHA